MLIAYVHTPDGTYASDWKHFERGVELLEQGRAIEAIKELEIASSLSPKASTLRKLAEAYELNKEFQKAAEAYYQEAAVHQSRGDVQTYLAVKRLADALHSEIQIYIDLEAQLPRQKLAKYEPAHGLYFGAYIEQDQIARQNDNRYRDFNELTGKNHSIFFTYHRYGESFPIAFAQQVKAVGGAIQLSLQPERGLAEVKDNAYLRQFARAANQAGLPIFLRFASEMNGDWVTWHGNPSLYREKFQLVAKVMKEEAPNVAMVWVPNSVPVHNIHHYYPGDKSVDWVGVNIYSVPFFNGNVDEPADHVNPLNLLDPIYEAYAARKPIMIGEFASSHFTLAGNQDVTNFGITKMRQFYEGIRIKYPRVKAIHWFSVNTLEAPFVAEERRLNNYSLTDNERFLDAYKEIIRHPAYRSKVVNGPFTNEETFKGHIILDLNGAVVRQSIKGASYVKTYDPYVSKVRYELNGRLLEESSAFPYAFSLEHRQLQAGENRLEAIVYDSTNNIASRKTITFTKGEAALPLKAREIRLYINERIAYTSEGPFILLEAPYVVGGRTLVPLRFISETLGANVSWDGAKRQVTVEGRNKKMMLHEGSNEVVINDRKITIDAAPEIRNGTTFVPLRFISEQLGLIVKYNHSTRGITLTY